MNAVIGMTGILLGDDLTPKQKEYVGAIRSSGDAPLAIINDILDPSKIDDGKMELECHPFDLRSCIEKYMDLVAPHAAEMGLDLAYLNGRQYARGHRRRPHQAGARPW